MSALLCCSVCAYVHVCILCCVCAGADLSAVGDVSDFDGKYTGLRLTPLHLAVWHSLYPPPHLATDVDTLEAPAWALLNLGAKALLVCVFVRACCQCVSLICSYLFLVGDFVSLWSCESYETCGCRRVLSGIDVLLVFAYFLCLCLCV